MDFSIRLRRAFDIAREELLAARTTDGHWVGQLSSSALSTATAVCALSIVERHDPSVRTPHSALRISNGLDWLARHVNPDGGWGDTTVSFSNLSTTTLCWAAFGVTPGADAKYRDVVQGAERWLAQRAGGIDPEKLAPAIIQRYGKDRTFSVPILTTCALSGRLGAGARAWKWVLPLPFELAALPHQFFAALRLPVVSYALPALIGIGQARHHHRPSRNPFARTARNLARNRTLKVLTEIQPSSGGFLEATPLTSFVVMSLAASGNVSHRVTKAGVEFLLAAARDDGSWPIDTNLATWVTTLAVNALANDPFIRVPLDQGATICDWLLNQQYRQVHPYTRAAPGGWAWTDLPGGVPDADDTAGALLTLRKLLVSGPHPKARSAETASGSVVHVAGSSAKDQKPCEPVASGSPSPGHSPLPSDARGVRGEGEPLLKLTSEVDRRRHGSAILAGVTWLLELQNSDGGIPTFCRGWTNLPFDRSAPDLTAHALRAWNAWLPELPARSQRRVRRAMERGRRYLTNTQTAEGTWIPLWFGNQHAPDESNPLYGTARVLLALTEIGGPASRRPIEKGAAWLLAAQKPDGSWGAPANGPTSVEETALAVEALAAVTAPPSADETAPRAREAAMNGARWLVEQVESGEWQRPSPIGFYFAKLWYFEQLYPQIFTVAALGRVARQLQTR